MIKAIFAFCFTVFIVACNSSSSSPESEEKKTVKPTEQKLTLENFADSLVRLDKHSKQNIEKAVHYFDTLVPADTTLADSSAAMLLRYVWTVVDAVKEELGKDISD